MYKAARLPLEGASVAANADGSLLSRQGYLPWGELGFAEGGLPGRYKFTGQASYEAEFGLYYFKARWYDPHLGRFSQPDSMVPNPGNPLDWDRYAYARNNPEKYVDPDGHFPWIPVLIGAGIGVAALGVISIVVVKDFVSTQPLKKPRADSPTSNDMTAWLTDRINQNATSATSQVLKDNMTSGNPVKMAGAYKAWVALVRTGAVWDFKVDILGAKVLDGNKNIVLGGKTLNFQAIANIHYGAIGRSVGIPQPILEMGAGAFQIYDNWDDPQSIGTLETYFDQYFDHWMVAFGGWLYDQYGDEFGYLTPEQLEQAYLQYQQEHGDPGSP